MSQNLNKNVNILLSDQSCMLKGYWRFSNDLNDDSGENNNLIPIGNPQIIKDSKLSGAVSFNGVDQYLYMQKPVLDTEGSYTVAAWVRLDSSTMNGKLLLKPHEHALTAVSQDTKTHSNFYLGLRQIYMPQPNGVLTSSLRWDFCVAPIDGSVTGKVEWQHAHTSSPLTDSALDKWFLLVGVCDAVNRRALIYVPNINETGMIPLHEKFVQLPVEGGLQVGRGRWLGREVDFWPGSIGPIKIFSGAMSEHDARALYANADL